MLTDGVWSPPAGAIETGEPGCWQAPSGDFYIDPAWDAERLAANDACQRRESEQRTRRLALDYDRLLGEIADLEMALYVWKQGAAVAVELWCEERERTAFAEDLLAAVLAERSR